MLEPETDTVTPGRTAPDASLTVPEMPPVVRCASAEEASASTSVASIVARKPSFMGIPFLAPSKFLVRLVRVLLAGG